MVGKYGNRRFSLGQERPGTNHSKDMEVFTWDEMAVCQGDSCHALRFKHQS